MTTLFVRVATALMAMMLVFTFGVIYGWPVVATRPHAQSARGSAEPWTSAETVEPAALAKELASASPSTRPLVVNVGFPSLYRGGHVPGASFHGPASSHEGLADLKRWAQGISRTASIVVYCGCCPMPDCPNAKPAFTTLRDLGFGHLRVLILPTNFGTDWVDKGYPVER
jgi:hypothetical protein